MQERISDYRQLLLWVRVDVPAPVAQKGDFPFMIDKAQGLLDENFDFHKARSAIFEALLSSIATAVQAPDASDEIRIAPALQKTLSTANLKAAMAAAVQPLANAGAELLSFLPEDKIEERLSPIGLMNIYRHYYSNRTEGVGPIEQAFTIAPNESFEVLYETSRRQTFEEISELGSETISESATEVKSMDEVSDRVSYMMQTDSSIGMSANASGGIGVWEAGVSANASMNETTQNNREEASKRATELNRRASERIRKSFSIKQTSSEETKTTNLTRRVITNGSGEPVNY